MLSCRKIWWLNPSYIVAVFLIPIYLLLWMVGEYTNGNISTGKGFYFFHGETVLLGLFGLITVFIGTLSPIKYIPSHPRNVYSSTLTLNMTVLTSIGCIAIIGYLYWFKDVVLNPGLLISQFQYSSSIGVRGVIERSSGIASLAQVGVVYIIFFLYQFISNNPWETRLHILYQGLQGEIFDGILVRTSQVIDSSITVKESMNQQLNFLQSLLDGVQVNALPLLVPQPLSGQSK